MKNISRFFENLVEDILDFLMQFIEPIVTALFLFIGSCFIIFIIYESYSHDKNVEANKEKNVDMILVSMNYDCSLNNNKFHRPQLCNTLLFKTIAYPYLYREINTCRDVNHRSKLHIDTKWLYNHQVGDTVHFDYLRKDLFFTIDR